MHHAVVTEVTNPGPVSLASKWRMLFVTFAVVGAASFAGGLSVDAARAWHVYLYSHYMFLCFALFGLFFTALNQAVNAKWSIAVRRVAEGFTAYLPVAALTFVGLAFGTGHLYDWAREGVILGDPAKYVWLSSQWFIIRGIVFFAVWGLFAWKLVGYSLKQDTTGDPRLSRKAINLSVVFFPLFAGTFTVAAFDTVMSLEHKFFSTMFGVYCFAGMFQSGLALLAILFVRLKQPGRQLHAIATSSHVKDLGGLLFAFTVFMTYIGFSQYMLIWYANMPEETFWYMNRQQNGWVYLFVLLPLFKFAIPFFGLLSQAMKKNEKWLTFVCWMVIIGQFLDLYWLVMPTYSESLVPLGWMEIGIWLGFAGLFGLAVSRFYAKYSILAWRDPRVLESANWRFWE